jgi:hypothetical protein
LTPFILGDVMEEPLSINEQTLMEQLDEQEKENLAYYKQETPPPWATIVPSVAELEKKNREEALARKNRKWDDGKLKYSLILPGFLELMAEILTRGEINHPCEPDGTPSWQLVEPKAYEDALFRHFQAYRKGEVIDTDPNMPTDHMGNIAVDAMFLWWFNRQKEGYMSCTDTVNDD